MKRALSLFLIFILLVSAVLPAAAAEGYTAAIDAQSAILYNCDAESVLYAKNASGAVLPGRTAILMTALITAESYTDLTETLTVDLPEGTAYDGVLRDGDTVTVKDLLAAMLLAGSENAALAAAEAVSFTPENFLTVMSSRAAQAGMTATVYTTVTGEPEGIEGQKDNQTTTVNDCLQLACAVLANETLSELLTDETAALSDGTQLSNGCSLLSGDGTVTGGFYGSAQTEGNACLLVTAAVDGQNLLCLMLGGSDESSMNSSAQSLLGYTSNTIVEVSVQELLGDVPLVYTSENGVSYEVAPTFPEGETVSVPEDFDVGSVSVRLEKDENDTGTASYLDGDGNVLAEISVTYTRVMSESEAKGRTILLWTIAALTLFCCIVIIFAVRRFYFTYLQQREARHGHRLDGNGPEITADDLLKGSFNYHFPLWTLWGTAVVLIIIIAICFNFYST